MKKIIPFAFLILIIFKNSTGQSLWVQTGLSYTTAEYKYQDHVLLDDETFKPRFQIGMMTEFPVTPIFSVTPGLIFQTKGYYQSFKLSDSKISSGRDLKICYLDIPVLLNLKIPFDKFGFFVEMGPYAGIGLSGTAKYYENTHETYTEKDKVKWGKDGDMKRMEYGIMGGAGAEISRFKLGLSYTHSMRDVAVPDDFVHKNRVLTVFVSYAVLRSPKK
ncbi:MAG: porin family protein [Draconibacterium sp.]